MVYNCITFCGKDTLFEHNYRVQVYVCVHVYVCVYVCIHVRTYVCMYVCIYVCKFICMYVYNVCAHVCSPCVLYTRALGQPLNPPRNVAMPIPAVLSCSTRPTPGNICVMRTHSHDNDNHIHYRHTHAHYIYIITHMIKQFVEYVE